MQDAVTNRNSSGETPLHCNNLSRQRRQRLCAGSPSKHSKHKHKLANKLICYAHSMHTHDHTHTHVCTCIGIWKSSARLADIVKR